MVCLVQLKCMLMTPCDTSGTCWDGCIKWGFPQSLIQKSITDFKTIILLLSINCLKLFISQALASEREFVLALLDPDTVVDGRPTEEQVSKTVQSDSGKIESDLIFVLDRIFEGVCRPFKVRVEQVLQSQPSLIVSYKLSNTLEFYSYTVYLFFPVLMYY